MRTPGNAFTTRMQCYPAACVVFVSEKYGGHLLIGKDGEDIMARNYAALPWEYLEEMDMLSDEQFGRLCRALLCYSAGRDLPDLPGDEKFLWKRVAMQEERFQKNYNTVTKSAAGKKGAAKRWQNKDDGSARADAEPAEQDDGRAAEVMADDSKAWQAMADDSTAWQAIADDSKNGNTNTKTDTKTETETETNTETGSPAGESSAQGRFCPPSQAEVSEYCRKRHSVVDPQRFVDYYAARGWKAGGSEIRDWRAALRAWESREDGRCTAPQRSGSGPGPVARAVMRPGGAGFAAPLPDAAALQRLQRLTDRAGSG